MTSVIKKSLYFILGFCFILPIINNSAVAQQRLILNVTSSDKNCHAGTQPTQAQRDSLWQDLERTPMRMTTPVYRTCKSTHAHFRSAPFEANVANHMRCTLEGTSRCRILVFDKRDGSNLTDKNISEIQKLLRKNGLSTMTYSTQQRNCIYYCQ